jgi:hypothetical protein
VSDLPEMPKSRFVFFLAWRRCAGPGCFSCCVEKLPGLFNFDPKTNAARCCSTQSTARPEWDYPLYQTVAQCPRNCIHYVTQAQLEVLREELASAVDGRANVDTVAYTLYELLVRTSAHDASFSPP